MMKGRGARFSDYLHIATRRLSSEVPFDPTPQPFGTLTGRSMRARSHYGYAQRRGRWSICGRCTPPSLESYEELVAGCADALIRRARILLPEQPAPSKQRSMTDGDEGGRCLRRPGIVEQRHTTTLVTRLARRSSMRTQPRARTHLQLKGSDVVPAQTLDPVTVSGSQQARRHRQRDGVDAAQELVSPIVKEGSTRRQAVTLQARRWRSDRDPDPSRHTDPCVARFLIEFPVETCAMRHHCMNDRISAARICQKHAVVMPCLRRSPDRVRRRHDPPSGRWRHEPVRYNNATEIFQEGSAAALKLRDAMSSTTRC